ncbi:hypothetical protein HID58_083965, partial [Brassica napus]
SLKSYNKYFTFLLVSLFPTDITFPTRNLRTNPFLIPQAIYETNHNISNTTVLTPQSSTCLCPRPKQTISNQSAISFQRRNLIQPSIPPEHAGLGSKIIQSFPEFPYSVKDRGMDQCSICLIDFMDDDTMRLISTCNHFFHTICIDLWFESHKTCPVYRCELDVHKKSSRLFLKTINGRYQIKGLYGILQDIHNLTCYLSTSVFSFISRKDNVAADNLAKKALLNFFNCM